MDTPIYHNFQVKLRKPLAESFSKEEQTVLMHAGGSKVTWKLIASGSGGDGSLHLEFTCASVARSSPYDNHGE